MRQNTENFGCWWLWRGGWYPRKKKLKSPESLAMLDKMNKSSLLDHESHKMLSTVTRKLKSQACPSKIKINKILLHLTLLAAFVVSLLYDDASCWEWKKTCVRYAHSNVL